MLAARADMLSYMDVGGKVTDSHTPQYVLIGEGFTSLAESKNPTEYSRQYVHERTERTDIIGYAPSYEYSTDVYTDNPVIARVMEITDREFVGTDAQVDIITVHTFQTVGSGQIALKRRYAVIPDGVGDGTEALIYTGAFKAVSDLSIGTFDPSSGEFTDGELGTVTIAVAAGSDVTHTKVSTAASTGTGIFKYKVGANLISPKFGDSETGYTALVLDTDITVSAGDKIIVAQIESGVIVGASAVTDVIVGE
jgi:hypothetical protein